jgi:small subunit ribosomal protein S20
VRKDNHQYYAKTARNAVKSLRTSTHKEEAGAMLPKLTSMLDKLAKKNIIHKKKASNLKSSLVKHVNSL